MDLKLTRNKFAMYGILGSISGAAFECLSLEHAYQQSDNSYKPKLPDGVYTCVRGTHMLHNLVPFETFEITGVPGATGILLHKGNYNKDSEGCVLLGDSLGAGCILDSADAFERFLKSQSGVDKFILTVDSVI